MLEVSLDGTCLEKTGPFPGLEIHRTGDGFRHQLKDKIGLHLVVLYVVVGDERFPWAYQIWRGKGTPSQPVLALKMLAQLPAPWKRHFTVRVLADNGQVACVPPLRQQRFP